MQSKSIKCKKNGTLLGHVQNSITNRNRGDKGKIDTHNTYIHYRFQLSTSTSVKTGRFNLALWLQVSPLGETMRSCKYFLNKLV
jgi:hypothetical protein